MVLMTADEYKSSLNDGRTVYYRGKKVDDVTNHPIISIAIEHASIDYEMSESEEFRDIAVVRDENGNEFSRYYQIPRDKNDLLMRSSLIEKSTSLGGTLVVLIKEIGTDALFALHLIASHMDKEIGTQYLSRIKNFYHECRDKDLAISVAQTDVKGDRDKSPSEQEDPDLYVRVVDQDSTGITIRGAKIHTSVSTNAHEIIVLPTRNMKQGEEEYAVACAVPANSPGLTMIASGYGSREGNEFENPISSKHKMMETLTIFEDVKVPWERVFLNGEVNFAGPLAKLFVEFHRFTAVSYKLPLVDLFVGASHLIAEYNGTIKKSHIRDKIAKLIAYAQICRGMTREAAHECKIIDNIAIPNAELINIAKLHFATGYHEAISWVQDIAGGLLVTGPSKEDIQNHELNSFIEKYLKGSPKIKTLNRLSLMNLISEITSTDFAGYQAVLAIHAEGSIEAEKMTIMKEHEIEKSIEYAKWLAKIK